MNSIGVIRKMKMPHIFLRLVLVYILMLPYLGELLPLLIHQHPQKAKKLIQKKITLIFIMKKMGKFMHFKILKQEKNF